MTTATSQRTSNFDRVGGHLETLNETLENVNSASESLQSDFSSSMTALMQTQLGKVSIKTYRKLLDMFGIKLSHNYFTVRFPFSLNCTYFM